MAVEEVAAKKLAERLDSTPGALYKTLHDARASSGNGVPHPIDANGCESRPAVRI